MQKVVGMLRRLLGDVSGGKSSLWNRAYVLLSVASFFSWLSYNMVTPVLTSYLKSMGAAVEVCGFIGGLFAGASLLTRPVSGAVADRFNRKWLNAGFTVVMALSLLAYSLIPSIGAIEVFRTLHGVAFGFSSTASLVLVSEVVARERMAEAISYYSVMSVASMTIGPSLGVFISSAMSYRACMLVGTAMLAVAAVLCAIVPYRRPAAEDSRITAASKTAGKIDQNKDKQGVVQRRRGGILRSVIAFSILDLSAENASFTLMNGVVAAFIVEYAAEEGIPGISVYFLVNALALVASRVLLSKRMNSWTLRTVLIPAFVTAIVSLVLVWRAAALPVLLVSAVLKAIGQGMSMPALQSEAFRSVPDSERGLASGTIYIGGDAGQAFGPILGGLLAGVFGYRLMFLISALPMAVMMIYFLRSPRAKS